MNSLWKFGIALAGVSLGIIGCTEHRVAGGTIETTNGITARVILPSGNPASNIKLMLLDEQNWLAKTRTGESIVLDSTETDSTGRFFIKVDSNITCGLMADVEDYGILIHDASQKRVDEDFGGKIGLRKKVTYQGTLGDTAIHAKQILLAGTRFSANVDSIGTFIITNIPQEQYSVVLMREIPGQGKEYIVSNQIKLDEFTSINRDTVKADTSKSLLVDDFEDMDNRNLIGPVLGGGWYDALDDFVLNGDARLLQPANAAISNWKSAITDGGPDHSKSLQVLYKMGTKIGVGQTYSFVNIEMHLGSQAAHYNLSNMDSLSFYAGGSGKLIIELIQQNPTGVALQVVASKTISLDANWQPFSIKPSDLNISVGWFPVDISLYKTELKEARLPIYTKAPATWTEMGGMVTIVNFKGTGGTEFWLDQIRLHGVNLGDLVK